MKQQRCWSDLNYQTLEPDNKRSHHESSECRVISTPCGDNDDSTVSRQWSQLWQRDNTMMMSVSLLYSIILVLVTITSGSPHDYDRGHPGVRRRVIIVRDHHDDRVRHVRRRVCHQCHQGSVSVVRESRPEVVVVDHGGHGYLQPEPAVVVPSVQTHAVVPAVQTHAVVQTPAVVAPAVHVPAAPSHSSIDPR